MAHRLCQEKVKRAGPILACPIAQGHSHSKFTYGFNLYYGSGDVKQDKTRGLKLLEEAAQEGVALARDELKLLAKSPI